jgi:hypothetical protein
MWKLLFRCFRDLPCNIREQEAPSSEQREKARKPSVDPIRDSVEFPWRNFLPKGSQLGATLKETERHCNT